MSNARHAWDQLSTETNDAYCHFLVYRNLGPTRSLNKAYYQYLKDYDGFTGVMNRGIRAPGNWQDESRDNFWVERSAAWDIRNLACYGAKVAIMHAECVAHLARKNLSELKKMRPGDEGWMDLMQSIKVVAAFLSPELVASIESKHKPARSAVGAGAESSAREQVE